MKTRVIKIDKKFIPQFNANEEEWYDFYKTTNVIMSADVSDVETLTFDKKKDALKWIKKFKFKNSNKVEIIE